MKRSPSVLALWGAVVLLSAGCCFVFHANEDRIRERIAMNERLESQVRADALTLAGEPALLAEWNRRSREARGGDSPARVAAFLADVTRSAARHHTVLATVAARAARDVFGARAIAPISLDVTLEGRFADILDTIRELSTARVPAAIDAATIQRKNGDPLDVTLTASLHVEIERNPRGPASSGTLSHVVRIVPQRDPFDRLAMPSAQAPAVAAAILPLRLNLGETTFAFARDTPMTAIVSGSHAFALVYANGTGRMVTLGDEIAGSRIRAIRDDGLWLASGARIPVAAPLRKRNRHDKTRTAERRGGERDAAARPLQN